MAEKNAVSVKATDKFLTEFQFIKGIYGDSRQGTIIFCAEGACSIEIKSIKP